jgi:hypothetical protein
VARYVNVQCEVKRGRNRLGMGDQDWRNPVEMDWGLAMHSRDRRAENKRLTPRLYHPDNAKVARMRFALFCVLDDLKQVGHGERDTRSA